MSYNINLKSLTKKFGDFTAVNDLNISIDRGEFIALLGPSGCGKTTTLQMIAGLIEPSAGVIELDGKNITNTPPNERGLGVVFQSYALFPHITIIGNVAFGLEMRNIKKEECLERAKAALDLVKLGNLAQRYPNELSGGQRQRVALARALVIEPPVLLLDEPLSNLDAKLREEMRIELRILQQEIGVTTILVTHDQEEALSMSDRIVVMENGNMVQIAKPLDIYEKPTNTFVSNFVGKTNLIYGYAGAGEEGVAQVVVDNQEFLFPGRVLTEGEKVTLSIRPEKLRISAQDIDYKVEVEVKISIFLGAIWLYQVISPMGELFVSQPNTGPGPGLAGFSKGDIAYLSWSDESVMLFSEAV